MTPTRALIAEDDDDLRTVLEILLSTEGWSVSGAASLDEARNVIQGDMPSLLVLDLQLADHVAGELLAELACREDSPVTVLVSGSEEICALAQRYGVAYARKPIDIDALMATIDRALARARQPTVGAARSTWVSIRPTKPANTQ